MGMQGTQVVVMGLGRFGGGVGVTKWLLDQGAVVLVTDLAPQNKLEEQLADVLQHPNLTLVCEEHRKQDFERADLVVANPAIRKPWDNPFLRTAWDAGVEVTTEIRLVISQLDRTRVIGVTGTSGKSTTAAMIAAALASAGVQSHLSGNIGGSLLSRIPSIGTDDVVVLELSSAMLWWLDQNSERETEGWSPSIAVLTNIEENHIDWHGSYEAYVKCKRVIFKHQEECDTALTQDNDATFMDLSVLGLHNQRNAAVALLAAVAIGADARKARQGICGFSGLPHRLQFVHGSCYNDSKSTTPSATKVAVDSFENPSSIHLIVGGFDKQVDLSVLAEQSDRVSCMYTIGATGFKIGELASGDVQSCGSLRQAVAAARENMQEGDVLLLSPGCASWDQFDNYEQRGEEFCSLVTSHS
jgi:UDP-N-acetylmuramoylalanine--D-glutamate ligase